MPSVVMSLFRTGDIDVLILCGGQGLRFRAVRDDIPKVLAPIRGKPFLDHLLDELLVQGFKRFILATGYLSDQVEAHVQRRKDAEFIISCEHKALGTGGAVNLAKRCFFSNPVLVMNGDTLIECKFTDLLEFHSRQEADLTLLLSDNTPGKDYGHVKLDTDQRILSFKEKPDTLESSLVNAGVYCLNPALLETIIDDESWSLERDLLPNWTINHRVFGMISNQPIYDIGTRDRYSAIQIRSDK
jgi:NDP-sugar pyrophosphorylase family protein